MAYFHCLIGGGSSGGGYELTVTCDAAFAGTTITCTDGVTTLTQTCPSASPYEVVFEIPNGGDWTISGVVSGQTVTTGVNIPTSVNLNARIQQTVTIYSAKEDTISYVDIDGATQTITFASGETSKQVTIAIEPNGSSITFTSSVAKNPSNLSQDYSKTFTITTSTTDIYLMPDAVNTLYWWGYQGSNFEVCSSANGWTNSSWSWNNPIFNVNNIQLYPNGSSSSTITSGVGNSNAVSGTIAKAIAQGITALSSSYGELRTMTSKSLGDAIDYGDIRSNTMMLYDSDISQNSYIIVNSTRNRSAYLYALWYE